MNFNTLTHQHNPQLQSYVTGLVACLAVCRVERRSEMSPFVSFRLASKVVSISIVRRQLVSSPHLFGLLHYVCTETWHTKIELYAHCNGCLGLVLICPVPSRSPGRFLRDSPRDSSSVNGNERSRTPLPTFRHGPFGVYVVLMLQHPDTEEGQCTRVAW